MRAAPVQQKTVIVTGCSTGIGLATAQTLRARGWQVVPTARKPADLEHLRAEGFDPVELDVTVPESVERAAAECLRRTTNGLGGIVNNAGFGQAGAVEDLTRELLRYQLEVNLIGMQDFANRFIPTFRRQGWGRIVNISSVLGRIAIPFNGAYVASKFAMEGLTDALRIELRGTGIGVVLVEPGPIVSKFRHNAAARAKELLKGAKTQHQEFYEREIDRRLKQNKKPDTFTRPPEAVADKIVHALESRHPKRRYCVTIPAYLGAFLGRFAPPAFLDWAMGRRIRRRD